MRCFGLANEFAATRSQSPPAWAKTLSCVEGKQASCTGGLYRPCSCGLSHQDEFTPSPAADKIRRPSFENPLCGLLTGDDLWYNPVAMIYNFRSAQVLVIGVRGFITRGFLKTRLLPDFA
jgi:hypothetical protein